MKTLLVIVGPTGVGKTEVSLRVAEALGCPIVNADSRQVYREIPIGTAAPTAAAMKFITHPADNMNISQIGPISPPPLFMDIPPL